ncbi:restriction endonuclease [Methylotetracoccus oryzae]|uniref:restriction endonuclease n=1 Tax=Methylotetracoccus oryzae TaxID=1919059 RepID=UPI001119D65D|nr:restriction endonuclease [Methylotetracoccus oryzae]
MVPSRRGNPFESLIRLPWWVSVLIAGIIYTILKYGLPSAAGNNPILAGLARALAPNAHWIALLFLLMAPASFLRSFERRKLLDRQSGIESMRAMSWKEFEVLCGEAFRRKGYQVEETGLGGAGGGIDLILHGREERVLVQCKRWKTFKVGVREVRELFGLLAADPADRAILITSGVYTAEARAFAKGKPLQLIDGHALLELVRAVQAHQVAGKPPGIQNATEVRPVAVEPRSARDVARR